MNKNLNFLPDNPIDGVGFVLWVVRRRKDDPDMKGKDTIARKVVYCKQDVYDEIKIFQFIPNCRIYVSLDGFVIKKSLAHMSNKAVNELLNNNKEIKDPFRVASSVCSKPENSYTKRLLWDIDVDENIVSFEELMVSFELELENEIPRHKSDKRNPKDMIIDSYTSDDGIYLQSDTITDFNKIIIDKYKTRNGYHIVTPQFKYNDLLNNLIKRIGKTGFTKDNIHVEISAFSLVYFNNPDDNVFIHDISDKDISIKENILSITRKNRRGYTLFPYIAENKNGDNVLCYVDVKEFSMLDPKILKNDNKLEKIEEFNVPNIKSEDILRSDSNKFEDGCNSTETKGDDLKKDKEDNTSTNIIHDDKVWKGRETHIIDGVSGGSIGVVDSITCKNVVLEGGGCLSFYSSENPSNFHSTIVKLLDKSDIDDVHIETDSSTLVGKIRKLKVDDASYIIVFISINDYYFQLDVDLNLITTTKKMVDGYDKENVNVTENKDLLKDIIKGRKFCLINSLTGMSEGIVIGIKYGDPLIIDYPNKDKDLTLVYSTIMDRLKYGDIKDAIIETGDGFYSGKIGKLRLNRSDSYVPYFMSSECNFNFIIDENLNLITPSESIIELFDLPKEDNVYTVTQQDINDLQNKTFRKEEFYNLDLLEFSIKANGQEYCLNVANKPLSIDESRYNFYNTIRKLLVDGSLVTCKIKIDENGNDIELHGRLMLVDDPRVNKTKLRFSENNSDVCYFFDALINISPLVDDINFAEYIKN